MFTRKNVLRLLLVGLLLALLAVPVLGGMVGAGVAAVVAPDGALLYHGGSEAADGVAVACVPGDPGGGQGGGC